MENLSKVFRLCADDFRANELNVIRAKYWSNSWPPLGATPAHERENSVAEEAHKAYHCRWWTTEGERCRDFFYAQSKSSAGNACSVSKGHARTKIVCFDDDDFQRVPDVRDKFFSRILQRRGFMWCRLSEQEGVL